MGDKYLLSKVGLILFLPGFISVFSETFPILTIFMIIPMLSIFPLALPLELIGNNLFEDYSDASAFVFTVLLVLSIFSIILYYKLLRKENFKIARARMWFFWGTQNILIHPLVFYLWAFDNASAAGDGQFIFGVFDTFPQSSFALLLLGLALDYMRNKNTAANNS